MLNIEVSYQSLFRSSPKIWTLHQVARAEVSSIPSLDFGGKQTCFQSLIKTSIAPFTRFCLDLYLSIRTETSNPALATMAWFSGPGEPHRYSTRSPSHYSYTSRHSSSSHYKRRPRDGYIAYYLHIIRRKIRHLYEYARRHPGRAFLMILPLITGGALAGILKQFGIRLPPSLSKMMGGLGDGRGDFGGRSSGYGGGGGEGGMQSMMRIAQMFM